MHKVCFFSGDITRNGGTERVTTEIVNGLVKYSNNYEIHILSLGYEKESLFFEINPRVKITSLYKEQPNFKKEYLSIVKKINNFVKQENIDILIDVDCILDIFSIPATILTKTKIISWEHFNFHENLGVKYRDWGRQLSSRFADHILTITKEDLNNYQENLKLRCSISNIYNPIKVNTNKYNYDTESKIILSAGRLTYQKGFDLALEVAREVFKEHKDWKWIILGEGEDREKLEELIKDYGLEQQVFLPGNVRNIEEYYSKAAMFVLTSRFEGLGMVILEAFNYNLPVVSFDCPVGPKEIIRDNQNGFLIKNNDIWSMSQAINKLIKDELLRKLFSQSTTIEITRFDIENIVNQWEKLLQEIQERN